MIVVDATVLADLLIGEGAIQASAAALVTEDAEWVSVGLWRYEVGNVCWKMQRFAGGDRQVLGNALAAAESLLAGTFEPDPAGVWRVACDAGLTFYDASYVWLAREKGLKLRTRDKEVLRECADVAEAMP